MQVVHSVGLSDYHDSTRHSDSLGLFAIVIVNCLIIHIVILYEIYADLSTKIF